jgi:hypothetical protein
MLRGAPMENTIIFNGIIEVVPRVPDQWCGMVPMISGARMKLKTNHTA